MGIESRKAIAVAAGERPAPTGPSMDFREFYEEHVAFVWRALHRLGVPDSYINDAMQDVHIIIFRKLPESPLAAEKNWILRICFRIAKDYRRYAHVRREVLNEEPILEALDPRGDAEVALQRREEARLFEEALARLDDNQRTVLVLAVIEGRTGEEIAQALRLPLGTVYSRLRLAHKAFRRAASMLEARQLSPSGGPGSYLRAECFARNAIS